MEEEGLNRPYDAIKPLYRVCFSPEGYTQAHSLSRTVIVVSILRSSSTIVSGLAHGVKQFVVVDTLEKGLSLHNLGFIAAGSRDGRKWAGCQLENSPLDYTSFGYEEKKVALVSATFARAIALVKALNVVVMGSFSNVWRVKEYLLARPSSVLIFCAGQQDGSLSMADILFSGFLYAQLKDKYTPSDEAKMAYTLYTQAQEDYYGFLLNFEHIQRWVRIGLEQDLRFCLTSDTCDVLPLYQRGYIEPYGTKKSA